MTDEKYVYQQDIREKAITARSARNTRTHNGKRGSVKFPSDKLSKKELNAMNGETKTYRLNDPMKWDEFKVMPKDLQKIYLESITKKWDAPCSALGDMLGVHRTYVSNVMKELGVNVRRRGNNKWDKDGFFAWLSGANISAADDHFQDVSDSVATEVQEEDKEPHKNTVCGNTEKLIPRSGNMTIEGSADKALAMAAAILCDLNVTISIAWVRNDG